MNALNPAAQAQRRRSVQALEQLLLASTFSPVQCRLKHPDGREAEVRIAESADIIWEVHAGGGDLETYTTLGQLVDAGWRVEA